MARTDKKIGVTELTTGSKFSYDGHKYLVTWVTVHNEIAYVYTAECLFPMEFYPDNEVDLISA